MGNLDNKEGGDKQWAFEINNITKAIRDLKQNVADLANDFQNYVVGLGAYESKSFGTVYEAETDGFVLASPTDGSASTYLRVNGYTDSNNPPTTVVGTSYSSNNGIKAPLIFPVIKGNYWKVVDDGSTCTKILRWIPLNKNY